MAAILHHPPPTSRRPACAPAHAGHSEGAEERPGDGDEELLDAAGALREGGGADRGLDVALPVDAPGRDPVLAGRGGVPAVEPLAPVDVTDVRAQLGVLP